MDEKERPVYAYIPPNIGGAGNLFNLPFDTRHLTEAGISAFLAFLVKALLSKIFTAGMISTYAAIIIGAPLILLSLTGIRGEPLSIFLLNVINYENRRIFVTLRPPMPEKEEKKKESRAEEKLLEILRR